MSGSDRTEENLRDFVDTAAIGLHWVAGDGTILWANPADYEPLGYSAAEYVGHNITEFHADDEVIADILRRLTAGERLHDYAAELRCKDGTTRNVLITSSVKFSESGEFLHTRCFTVDVTGRRSEGASDPRVEALCREVERLSVLASHDRGLVESILNVSPYGIIVCDAQGKLTLQNRAAERIWAGSASAGSVEGWGKYRGFHPDGRPYEGGDWAMARCLTNGETVQPEQRTIQRFDDSFGVILGGCAPIRGPQGEIQGAVATFAVAATSAMLSGGADNAPSSCVCCEILYSARSLCQFPRRMVMAAKSAVTTNAQSLGLNFLPRSVIAAMPFERFVRAVSLQLPHA